MSITVKINRFTDLNEQGIKRNRYLANYSYLYKFTLFISFFIAGITTLYAQNYAQTSIYNPLQTTNNFMANSSAFKQEIARMEITVSREGKEPISITQVPRLEKNDVLKVHLLDEVVNGVKPDQSNWNWSFLVAFINPARNNEKEKSVSEEIQFRKSGWYKEYSFTVPYDSQPIFFLYSKPNYRSKILTLVNKNQEEIRKIGEKTIELSGAYAKIGAFLDELQYVVNASTGYGGYAFNSYNSGGYGNGGYGGYGNGGYGSYYGGGGYGYGSYGSTQGFNANLFMNQSVERLARSFNIGLPTCWQNGGYGSYSAYGSSNGTQNNIYYGVQPDFIGRTQCLAKSVNVQDFDFSVSRLLQQGGILGVAQLTQKYPQLAFWINVAAASLDFINKFSQKSPLRIVPTVVLSSDNANPNSGYQNAYANNFASSATLSTGNGVKSETAKISIYAESPPTDNGFVTGYPIVIQKWQANADPAIINLPTPALSEPCLHPGQNLLKSTDIVNDWMTDNFTKDFKLIITSTNGFRKEFPLKKNIGMGGWELFVTREELNSFPQINMPLQTFVSGKRGFNEIKSPNFTLPTPISGVWKIDQKSQNEFVIGEKRRVVLKNPLGNCRCLQTVVYKPSFGGEFIFETNSKENNLMFSEDGSEVSFEVDATYFQPGIGKLELRQFGSEVTELPITLYPAIPVISNLKIAKGDTQAIIFGERLEQLQAVSINGKRAIPADKKLNELIAIPNNIPFGSTANIASPPKNERVFVFEDPKHRQDSNTISLELELENNRIYQSPKTFGISPARPIISANAAREVEGVAVKSSDLKNSATVTQQINQTNIPVNKNSSSSLPVDLEVFPTDSSKISVNLQNALTDYDFKVENIQIETRIENTETTPEQLPKVNFEVLDWKNIKVDFVMNDEFRKIIGSRRLQFRIRDKIRGTSDWYILRKTFARIPQNTVLKCTVQLNGDCQLIGDGTDYISQVSVDGGKTWFPQGNSSLSVETTSNGQKVAKIPRITNKNLLLIKLRDLPTGGGILLNKLNNPFN